MRVYTHVDAVLGPKRSFTPEGFLFCEDVPLARTGEQVYLPSELPGIPPGPDGLIHVERRPEEVFTDRALASFVAKPFTDDHPSDNLDPKTYREHVRGTVLNPRRGTGEHIDLMVGDILVCDREAIQAILDGKREVSCGYSADYEVIGPGRARQFDIVGNHVALVKAGRCGGRCAVGDHEVTEAARTAIGKVTWKERAKAAALVQDQAALDAALAEADTGPAHHIHVNVGPAVKAAAKTRDSEDEDEDDKKKGEKKETSDAVTALLTKVADSIEALGKRIAKLEGKKTGDEEKSEEKKDDDKKEEKKETSDAAPFYTADQLPDAIQDLAARAEILVPGIRLPALDAKGDPKAITESICRQRRTTLVTAMYLPKTQDALSPLLKDMPNLDKMTCDQVAVVFAAASENMKTRNNSSATSATGTTGVRNGVRKVGDQEFSGEVTIAEINARNAHFNKTARGSR